MKTFTGQFYVNQKAFALWSQILFPALCVTQPSFICSKSTMEILEQSVKYAQS